jgi:hypothetical protein
MLLREVLLLAADRHRGMPGRGPRGQLSGTVGYSRCRPLPVAQASQESPGQ